MRRRWAAGGLGLLAVVGAAASWRAMSMRTWQAFGTLVARVETPERRLALTFDDGPDDAHVDEVLGVLAAARARATFFVIGSEVAEHPDALRKIAAAGHELGNHGWSHARMVFRSPSWMAREIDDTDRVLAGLGVPRSPWFRPPYCKKGLALPWVLAREGRTTVTWDVEPESDPALASDPEALRRAVRAQVRPGSIVLLHPWYGAREATRRALPGLLADLAADGWALVTVSELVARVPVSARDGR